MHYSSTGQQKGRWEGDVGLLRAQLWGRRHLRRRQDRGRQRCQAWRTGDQEVEVEEHHGHWVDKQVPLSQWVFKQRYFSWWLWTDIGENINSNSNVKNANSKFPKSCTCSYCNWDSTFKIASQQQLSILKDFVQGLQPGAEQESTVSQRLLGQSNGSEDDDRKMHEEVGTIQIHCSSDNQLVCR